MFNSALTEQVREVMASAFAIEASDLPDDVSQENLARWTSLYHMILLVSLEESYGIAFSMEEMTAMTSLTKIIAVLKQHSVEVGV